MGRIVDTKNLPNGKLNCSLLMNIEEALSLQGNLKNIHFFSPDACATPTETMKTGIGGSTKYFRIPDKFIIKTKRKGRKKNFPQKNPPISCQKIETANQTIFIYLFAKKSPEE